jgi:flagellar biosynthetic protein FlhB
MAEDIESRTEAATPRRREEAREQGQVAFSTDLVSGVLLVAAMGVLCLGASRLGLGLLTETRLGILAAASRDLTVPRVQSLLAQLVSQCAQCTGPLLGTLFAVGLAICLVQVGVRPNPALIGLDWERLWPASGGRLLSWRNTMRGLFALVRLAVVGLLAWWVLARQGPNLAAAGGLHLPSAIGQAWTIVMRLALAIAGGFLLLGVTDYFWQFWRLEQSLRMTRQEVKDEAKREEGDPLVRARVRRLQRETARKKMMQEVRRATVVVTNPTHLAVALRYDRATMSAPRVVAKGAGHMAHRIADLARRHNVPVLERRSLAQALFRTVKLNQDIPVGLYVAVAEVLAHIYRLRNPGATEPPG